MYKLNVCSQEESTFSNNPTCVHLHVGGHNLVLFALTFRYRVVLQGYLLFVDHCKKIKYLTFLLMYPLEKISTLHVLILHSSEPCRDIRNRRIKIRHKDYGHSSYQKCKC